MCRKLLASAIAGLLTVPAAFAASVDPEAPLSSMVAVRLTESGYGSIPELVRAQVNRIANGESPVVIKRVKIGGLTFPKYQETEFPLKNATDDHVRSMEGTAHNVVIKWLDPLTNSSDVNAPRYGANNDYIAYFGDGWNSDWQGEVVGSAPQFNGSGSSGWIWTNHEYISNSQPSTSSAPTGQHMTLAKYLKSAGILNNDVESDTWSQADVDTYIQWFKKQIGGTWMRVYQDSKGEWHVNTDAPNMRYDSTDATISTVTGYTLTEPDHDDSGNILAAGAVVGIAGDCSGGQSPFGTVLTAEENVQDYYGDLEATWSSNQLFRSGNGFDAGANIDPDVTPSESGQYGRISDPNQRHNRDVYGFLVEMDPGLGGRDRYTSINNQGSGYGHRKIGSMGRARWENATFYVGEDWKLVNGQPVVIYGANDRRSGRIYKWVSNGNYTNGMTRGQVRALIDEGKLYVAHYAGLDTRTGFTLYDANDTDCDPDPAGKEAEIIEKCTVPTAENPGQGQWIWLSVDNDQQIAPNAAALGSPNTTVGQALRDVNWNSLGGFPDDNAVKSAMFTAGMKLGVMELNRPEDVEWNAKFQGGPAIHVAFTKNGRRVALQQNGVLWDPAVQETQSPTRIDGVGSIFTMREANPSNPAVSETFTYELTWIGTRGDGPNDAANPDNLAIDSHGGLWFGTDGNFGRNGTADAVYYLDLDPAHKNSPVPTYGKPFRVAAGPGDSESTGPAFSSDEKTLFFNVQHPGEDFTDSPSTWPQDR